MNRARWIRIVLLVDVVVIVSWQLVLLLVRSFGVDIQPLKWPTVFYSGVLLLLAIALSTAVVSASMWPFIMKSIA